MLKHIKKIIVFTLIIQAVFLSTENIALAQFGGFEPDIPGAQQPTSPKPSAPQTPTTNTNGTIDIDGALKEYLKTLRALDDARINQTRIDTVEPAFEAAKRTYNAAIDAIQAKYENGKPNGHIQYAKNQIVAATTKFNTAKIAYDACVGKAAGACNKQYQDYLNAETNLRGLQENAGKIASTVQKINDPKTTPEEKKLLEDQLAIQQKVGSDLDSGATNFDIVGNDVQCWPGGLTATPNWGNCVKLIMGWVSYMLLWVWTWVVGVCGLLFNTVMGVTVVDMANQIKKIQAINDGWRVIRDFGNIIFIFILLYVAIKTILGLSDGNTKRIIVNIIIVGLLVNFSLFFTKVMIDASNISSLFFYNALINTNPGGGFGAEGIADKFAQSLGITSIFNPDSNTFLKNIANQGYLPIIITGIGGSLFLIVTALTFLFASLLFAFRFVILIILMVLSPLAYIFLILPSTKPLALKWWNLLAGQLIFAPVYMVLILIAFIYAQNFSVANSGGQYGIAGLFNIEPATVKAAANTSATGFTGNSAFNTLFHFIVIIGLMNLAAVVAWSAATNTGGFVGGIIERSRNNFFKPGRWAGRRVAGGTAAVAARELQDRRGRSAYNALQSPRGEELKRRAADGDEKAKKQLKKLETRASADYNLGNTWIGKKLGLTEVKEGGYRTRVTTQKAKNDSKIARKGKPSRATRRNIETARANIDAAKEQYRVAAAANNQADMNTANEAIKTHKAELARYQRAAATEIRNQRRQYAARLAKRRSLTLSPAVRDANIESSDEFLEKFRSTKKTDEEKVAEFQDRILGELAPGGSRTIAPILDEMSPNQIKQLSNDTLRRPEVAQHFNVDDIETLRKSGKLTNTDKRAIGNVLRERAGLALLPVVPPGSPAGTPPVVPAPAGYPTDPRIVDYFTRNTSAEPYWQ